MLIPADSFQFDDHTTSLRVKWRASIQSAPFRNLQKENILPCAFFLRFPQPPAACASPMRHFFSAGMQVRDRLSPPTGRCHHPLRNRRRQLRNPRAAAKATRVHLSIHFSGNNHTRVSALAEPKIGQRRAPLERALPDLRRAGQGRARQRRTAAERRVSDARHAGGHVNRRKRRAILKRRVAQRRERVREDYAVQRRAVRERARGDFRHGVRERDRRGCMAMPS